MIDRIKRITFIALSIGYAINLIAFDYHTVAHDFVVHLFYLLIILGILWTKRLAFYVLIFLIGLHLTLDWIVMADVPTEAIIESLFQFTLAGVLLVLVLNKEYDTKRIKDIVNATNVGTWEWHFKTGKVIINDHYANMLGYTKEELEPISANTWSRLAHPEDLKKSDMVIEKVKSREHEFYEIDARVKHKDGHWVWIHDRGKITKWSPLNEPLVMSGTHTDISARKAVLEKEKYYLSLMSYIINHAQSGVAVHDKDLNYVFVSQKYIDQYHLEDKDIIGKHHYEVFPDLPQKWRDVHKRALEGEITRNDRDPFERADGHVDWTRWECRPWYDEHDEIAGIIIYTEVINTLIKNEHALEQSRNRLQTIMDHLPIGLAVNSVVPDVEFEYMNDQFTKIYGVSETAIKKHGFWESVYHDETNRNKVKTMVEKDTATGDISKMAWYDVPIIKKTGEVLYINAYNTPLPTEDNQFVSTVIDVTKRKQLEDSLEETINELFIQKKEIEATLLAIGDAVIATDKKGIINNFNDIAAELTGYKTHEAIGKPLDEVFVIVNEATKDPLPSPVKTVIETKKTVYLQNHTMLITKDNTHRIIEDSASPIKSEDGDLSGVILVFRDVTEKKQKQKEIEYLSLHDHLTGIYNRRFFADELARIDKESHYPLGIVMVDLNGLKILNDAYGHDVGDLALKEVSKAMISVIGSRGLVARIGGDEFSILLSNTSDEEINSLKEKLQADISARIIKNASLSISIGYDIKFSGDKTLSETLKNAENNMYKMKLVSGVSARKNTIQAILKTLTDKYILEHTHSKRVSNICYLIGKHFKLNKDDLEELKLSGMFHDIGKISLPDNILNKPGKLTKEEYTIVKEHTGNGYQILRAADEYSDFAEHALYHHEWFNGKGYPDGLKGESIPFFARVISVADAFEAMTSDRPYKKAMSHKDAIEELKAFKGSQFDPKIVDAFIDVYKTHRQHL